MNRNIVKIILSIVFFVSSVMSSEQVVRMRPKQSTEDASHDYFIGLAKLALEKTQKEYGAFRIEIVAVDMTQERALSELSRGSYIDLDWAGTDISREKILFPIRIPLDGGLLGYRIPVIRKESVHAFDKITTLAELRRYKAVQGLQWPDTRVLEGAGITVEKPSHFKVMYSMLKSKRVDFFPRGLNEVYPEVDGLKDPSIVAYDKLLVVYPLPMYFFTSKANRVLAQRIEKGLLLAIDDGSLLNYMKKSPVMEKAFPLSKYKSSRKIFLKNPSLPKETPLNNRKLWLELK